MNGWKWSVRLAVFLYGLLLAFATQAQVIYPSQVQEQQPASTVPAAPASAVPESPASAVPATPASAVPATPIEDYEAGIKADLNRDMIGAIKLFQRSADAGYAPAQVRYADTLKRGQLLGPAVKYYRMSIQGNKEGQYGLGTLYEAGEGVRKDEGVARFLYEMAGEQGHAEATIKIFEAYRNGLWGIDETAQKSPDALSWMRRAVGLDHIPALESLATAYREGQFGLKADPEQADLIIAKINSMRGIVVKTKPKSALFKLLKGDPEKNKK